MSKKCPHVHNELDYLQLCLPMIPFKILRFDLQLCHIFRPAQFMVNCHHIFRPAKFMVNCHHVTHMFLQNHPLYLHHQVCSHTQYFTITHQYQNQLQGIIRRRHLYQRINFETGCSNDLMPSIAYCLRILDTTLSYHYAIIAYGN